MPRAQLQQGYGRDTQDVDAKWEFWQKLWNVFARQLFTNNLHLVCAEIDSGEQSPSVFTAVVGNLRARC